MLSQNQKMLKVIWSNIQTNAGGHPLYDIQLILKILFIHLMNICRVPTTCKALHQVLDIWELNIVSFFKKLTLKKKD